MDISEKILQLRKASNMTQEQLAERAVSYTHLSWGQFQRTEHEWSRPKHKTFNSCKF